MVSSDFFH